MEERTARVIAGMLRLARRLATLVVAIVGVSAALTVVAWGCVTTVERGWNPPERRDAQVRCPWFGRAEVDIGGWGEPDWCVRIDAAGHRYGERVVAGPYD